ncbi:hypothetical protein AABB24_002519 [Solanum stoloniferum]|uniref:Uncharacterized protein n=1 Tax=Solanum stoloniferum TaxID=62892 RepID=A0ABD2VPZ9_9SOLN
MSLKGRGQGVDLGTSTLSLMRSIFFSFLGLEFPYESLNLFPFFVLLSPRPQRIGPPIAADGAAEDEYDIRCSITVISLLAAVLHHCVIAISDFTLVPVP